jgi:hypothetical protein
VAYGINKSGRSTRESPAKRYRLTGAHCFLTELFWKAETASGAGRACLTMFDAKGRNGFVA